MHIGLIGGIGPAATDFYYRRLISTFASRKAALELTIVHADTPTLLKNLSANDVEAQVAIYTRLTNRLVAAGAACVVVTSIAGHFCIEAFKALSPLPVVDMIPRSVRLSKNVASSGSEFSELARSWKRFYGGVRSADIIPPSGSDLDDVHQAYVAMAASGVVTEAQRSIFNHVSRKLLDEDGAEAIMLGGTDLALVFSQDAAPFPLVDCAAIHVDAIARLAIA
ncbi:aspartate/glutamate racemase family protein [Bradyrhizobium sp. HKCCYLS1011]|uniref:aspartate/glutamate racemase family protein n=1 Tax=Bradyrhizobium sp. HKCCYLS1011 TaxID=3420733 RepID=UPI003EBED170